MTVSGISGFLHFDIRGDGIFSGEFPEQRNRPNLPTLLTQSCTHDLFDRWRLYLLHQINNTYLSFAFLHRYIYISTILKKRNDGFKVRQVRRVSGISGFLHFDIRGDGAFSIRDKGFREIGGIYPTCPTFIIQICS